MLLSFFQNFGLLASNTLLGVGSKSQKMAQIDKKKLSRSISQELYLMWFLAHICKMMISPASFSKFINKCQKEILRCAPPSSYVCDFFNTSWLDIWIFWLLVTFCSMPRGLQQNRKVNGKNPDEPLIGQCERNIAPGFLLVSLLWYQKVFLTNLQFYHKVRVWVFSLSQYINIGCCF